MKTRSHDMLHLYPTHTTGACDILKQSTVKSLIWRTLEGIKIVNH